jgi:hypothetical protein
MSTDEKYLYAFKGIYNKRFHGWSTFLEKVSQFNPIDPVTIFFLLHKKGFIHVFNEYYHIDKFKEDIQSGLSPSPHWIAFKLTTKGLDTIESLRSNELLNNDNQLKLDI